MLDSPWAVVLVGGVDVAGGEGVALGGDADTAWTLGGLAANGGEADGAAAFRLTPALVVTAVAAAVPGEAGGVIRANGFGTGW